MFASIEDEEDDDYFGNLRKYLEPELLVYTQSNVFYSNVVSSFRSDYANIRKQISEIDETIEKFETDLKVLSDAGEKLMSIQMKQKLREVCEEFIIQNELDKIKERAKELYDIQSSYLKSMSPLMYTLENTVCPICFERPVYVYNQNCGHTFCVECSLQTTKKCPMCRSETCYKPMIFSV